MASDGQTQNGIRRADIESVIAKTPFAVWIGVSLHEYGDGQASLSIPFREDLTMHLGFAHGAVVGFLADSACAWAGASVVGNLVTAEYKLNLLAPAVGERLMATGSVVKVTGRMVVCRAEVYSEAGQKKTLIAIAQATLMKFM